MNVQAILQDLSSRGVRIWAEGDKLKLDAPVGVLTDDDKAKLSAAKPDLLTALQPAPGVCPKCRRSVTLQQKDPATFWCAGCRIFSDGAGKLTTTPTRKPISFEIREAQQLVGDLLAVGCSITATGSDVIIGNLANMTEQLWARIEGAGTEFLQVAREMAEEFKNERASQWKH